MMTLADVRGQIAATLDGFACSPAPDAWRWHADARKCDCATSLHACKLVPAQEQELVQRLQEGDFAQALALVWMEGGFLNLQFTSGFWANAVGGWLIAPETFVHDCGLPADLWELTIFWRYRILKTFHQAAKLAAMEGWITDERLHCAPPFAEISKLKSLLALGGMLHHKRELQLKRTQMMTQIEAQIAELWQKPILLPADPAGSAWRQAVLRLTLAAAGAIGAPLKQSMEEALRMQYS
jgi:hypothetical protein